MIMKRIAAISVLTLVCIYSFAIGTPDTIQRIPIDETNIATPGFEIQRGLSPSVEAFYNITQGYIELEYEGIGDAYVYIVNWQNQIVESTTLYKESNWVLVNIPDLSGEYTIVVVSDDYYGSGNFVVK